MPDRIVLEPDEIAGLIRGARLPELREDTPPEVRRRWTDTALTAMDALCGLAESPMGMRYRRAVMDRPSRAISPRRSADRSGAQRRSA